MTRYGLVVVEGPHDRAFVGRVLALLGFKSFRGRPKSGRSAHLDPFWAPWVPTYPRGDNLYLPLDMPDIWETADWSVGVRAAGGSEVYSTMPQFLEDQPEWLRQIQAARGAVGVVVDADEGPPAAVYDRLRAAWSGVLGGLPEALGTVRGGEARVGAFVLPDNREPGTVESVLLPLGERALGPLLCRARWFVRTAPAVHASRLGRSGRLKATVAAAASILQPGSTNTVTIERDDWITSENSDHPALAPFVGFIRNLLDLPEPS